MNDRDQFNGIKKISRQQKWHRLRLNVSGEVQAVYWG